MKNVKGLSLSVAVVVLLSIVACHRNPAAITLEQATEIAQDYFRELYNLDVTVKRVSRERVGQDSYLNFISLFAGEIEYTLILDEYNKPLSDNVSALERMKNIDFSLFDEAMKPLGLKRQEYEDYNGWSLSYQNLQFQFSVVLSVISVDPPNKNLTDGIYALLNILKGKGVDELVILIHSPDFLQPPLQLYAEVFNTDTDMSSFEAQYDEFVNCIFWDKKKFEDIVDRLKQEGYDNVYFFIKDMTISSIEIVLHCESDVILSDDQATAILIEMDDSYFRRKIETKYTLEHVYK